MTVYVDNAQIPFRRMKMCHMIADSLHELHAMAQRLGLKRRWFQDSGSFPHYDICLSKRALAVQYGAVEVGRKELVKIMKELRG